MKKREDESIKEVVQDLRGRLETSIPVHELTVGTSIHTPENGFGNSSKFQYIARLLTYRDKLFGIIPIKRHKRETIVAIELRKRDSFDPAYFLVGGKYQRFIPIQSIQENLETNGIYRIRTSSRLPEYF